MADQNLKAAYADYYAIMSGEYNPDSQPTQSGLENQPIDGAPTGFSSQPQQQDFSNYYGSGGSSSSSNFYQQQMPNYSGAQSTAANVPLQGNALLSQQPNSLLGSQTNQQSNPLLTNQLLAQLNQAGQLLAQQNAPLLVQQTAPLLTQQTNFLPQQSQPQNDPNVGNDTIYVSGFPESTTVQDLKSHFGSIGVIRADKRTKEPKITIYKDHETGASKGDAIVTYEDPEGARAAISWFNSKEKFSISIQAENKTTGLTSIS